MVPTYHQLLVSMTGTDVPPASGINDWLADAPDAAVRPGGHSSVTIVTQRHAIARRHAPRRALRRRGRTTAAQLGKRPTTSLRRRISGSRRASGLFDQTCRQSATRQAVKPSRSPGPSARPLPPPGESRPTGMPTPPGASAVLAAVPATRHRHELQPACLRALAHRFAGRGEVLGALEAPEARSPTRRAG